MPGLDDVSLHLIDSLDDVLAFREWLGRRRPEPAIGFDTETTGLDVRNDRVRLIQFGDATDGWAFARDDWLGVARQTFREFEGRLIGHNAPYDTSVLHHSCGVDVQRDRVDDTMKMARVNEPHMSMALKTQASRHVDPAAAGLQVEWGKATGWSWATVPIDYAPYWSYGALDPVLTYKLDEYHRPIVQAEAPRAYDLEMAVGWVVERMEDYGVCVDVENARRLHREFTAYCERVERWCVETYGVKPGSNARVIEALESEGYSFSKATRSGAKSLDVEVLGGIDHPLAEAVLNRRQLQKMASTYLHHYATEATADWLLHPSINTLGAKTSRMSMSDPNLQNLPRRGTTRAGDVVRSMVISRYARGVPADEYDPLRHGALLMCDFSQIEMRLLAHMADEHRMIEAFRSEGDFFVNLARQIFDDPTLTKKDPRRQVTKNAGYATIYGAGIPKFAQTAGVTLDVARSFMTRWNQLYPRIREFQNDVINGALESARVGEPCGTRSPLTNRWFIADDANKAYALVNYRIQGTAAEVLKMKIVELDAAGLGDFMVAPVHDEIILDVPPEHVHDAVRVLQKVMNDDTLLSVPITAEVSYGRTWGEKSEWSRDE